MITNNNFDKKYLRVYDNIMRCSGHIIYYYENNISTRSNPMNFPTRRKNSTGGRRTKEPSSS